VRMLLSSQLDNGVSSLPRDPLHICIKAWSWHCWIDEVVALEKECSSVLYLYYIPKMVINENTCAKQPYTLTKGGRVKRF
jgi:hypothetical protein